MEGPPGWTAEHPEGWDPTEWMYDPLKPYIPPRPEGWVGPWPPGSPEPPKPIFLDPAQLGVPGMYPGSGFPPGHQNNPYDWDRFWERHRVV